MLPTTSAFSSPSSDYYSSSDLEFDDDHDDSVLAQRAFQPSNFAKSHLISSAVAKSYIEQHIAERVEYSLNLLQLVQYHDLSDEIFIRANTLLHRLLASTTVQETQLSSILMALISISVKLAECADHYAFLFAQEDQLLTNEEMICEKLNWDLDLPTPVSVVEKFLSNMNDHPTKNDLRRLTYHLIVLCITDIRSFNISVTEIGVACLLAACQSMHCFNLMPIHLLREYEQQNAVFVKKSLAVVRDIISDYLCL